MGGFGSGLSEKSELKIFRKISKDRYGCWIFPNHKLNRYAAFDFKGVTMGAHRASYLMFKGRIPVGKVVMHLCDNRRCVNPDHLKIGTYKENIQDMQAKGRDGAWKRLKKKCSRGHDLTKASKFYHYPSGGKRCLKCKIILRQRERKKRSPRQLNLFSKKSH